jgi:hypothetical protein
MSNESTAQITEEILAWYNDNDEAVKATTLDDEVWGEFYETLSAKEYVEKYDWATTAVLESGPAYIVQDVGGGEGEGEERWVVFSVGDKLFQVSGYYSSWDGTTWEDVTPREVEAYEVSVTRYRRKQG